jgi:hypothetical protein
VKATYTAESTVCGGATRYEVISEKKREATPGEMRRVHRALERAAGS